MTETYKFKVVLLGEGRVGKTSLLLRFVENRFSERQQSTSQASYLEKIINIGSCSVTLAIWDTAGQERFHALAPIYYRDADGAILVFDITDQTSFNKVQHWVEELRKIVGEEILVIVASNKQDLESKRQISEEQAKSYASKVHATLIPTSAKSGNGVEEVFLELTKQLLQRQKLKKSQKTGIDNDAKHKGKRIPNLGVDEQPTKKNSSGCCTLI